LVSRRGNGHVVDDVQQRDGDDERAEEPVGHVDVLDRRLAMVPKNSTA
jgi:hypothetical protein